MLMIRRFLSFDMGGCTDKILVDVLWWTFYLLFPFCMSKIPRFLISSRDERVVC